MNYNKELENKIKNDILNNKIPINRLYNCFFTLSNDSFYYNHRKKEYNILDDVLNDKLNLNGFYYSITYGTSPNYTIKYELDPSSNFKYGYKDIFLNLIENEQIQSKLKHYVYSFKYSNLSSKQQEILNY